MEYGRRNRLVTVFWYLNDCEEGGETFFPRALNENGTEYHPWNGDHKDCYRGLYVKPVKGNAVLFYSLLPDGRLDERSLHGGCSPRNGAAKFGVLASSPGGGLTPPSHRRVRCAFPLAPLSQANQWVWNTAPKYRGQVFPRRGQPGRASGTPGCEDKNEFCAQWAGAGECERNAGFMLADCAFSCGQCG